MTKELIEHSHRHRGGLADLPLVALTAGLVVSLAIALTTVSIGIARADTLAPFGGGGGRYAAAALAGVVIAGFGLLTAALLRRGNCRSRGE